MYMPGRVRTCSTSSSDLIMLALYPPRSEAAAPPAGMPDAGVGSVLVGCSSAINSSVRIVLSRQNRAGPVSPFDWRDRPVETDGRVPGDYRKIPDQTP